LIEKPSPLGDGERHFLNSYDPTLNALRLGLIKLYEQTTDEELRKRIWELIERAGGPPVIVSSKNPGDAIAPDA